MKPVWTVHPNDQGSGCCVRFSAMASPCEIWIDGGTPADWPKLARLACDEALRIEHKWSRYRTDNLVHRINTAEGAPIAVDAETARMIDFGELLYRSSDGRFDLTAGVLRRAWRFTGAPTLPDPGVVRDLLQYVGWWRVSWSAHRLQMQPGMEIDFGGIGKEYAVDHVLAMLSRQTDAALLVNFGGDLAANAPRRDGTPWRVGIETAHAERSGTPMTATPLIRLHRGGVATSGDARRHVLHDGVRYGHVLDARSGWPVPNAPHSVTVAGDTCVAAGSLATLALLSGAEAEHFLEGQATDFHVLRDGSSQAT